MLALRILLGTIVLWGGPFAASQAHAAGRCGGPLAVLIDRSGSVRSYDPTGGIRLELGAALDAARPATDGDLVVPFDGHARGAIAADTAGWEASVVQAMAGGDRGAIVDSGSVITTMRRVSRRY